MQITFLAASVPLTKTYAKLPDGTIEKTSYPNVWEVSSIVEECPDLETMETLLNKHAALGHCMLKGMVTRPLVQESRKDSTDRNATTNWLCLDIDGISPENGTTIPSILEAMGLGTVSYLLQWSGSMGIGTDRLRCHVFVLLTRPVSAPLIKQWLIQKNHEVPVLHAHQSLTSTGNSLSWGLDITACQADKLIYIAPPTLKNIRNPLGKLKRVSLHTRQMATFDLAAVKINGTEQNRALTDARVLELRDRAGLPKRKLTYKIVGAHEVLAKPGECIATETKTDRGFVYFNLNGGDSWAYYHPENNPDFIFNFKGEPVYQTKELLPSYWESLKTQAFRVASNGLTYLAFLDRKTSIYWRGTYDAEEDVLDLHAAKNESMVRQFADANGLRLGDNIPEWDMEFNPTNGVRVDFDNRTVNTFERTIYMKAPAKKVKTCPPMIHKLITHILNGDAESTAHFMNWLACIAQNLDRTRTAWVWQGIPGTGKGLFFNRVLKPLFGEKQTVIKRAGELTEKWTDFVEGKFIVFIDEIQTSALRDEAGVIANMKNLITEPTAMIRAMNRNSFPVPNYSNWIFASNKPDPVSVDRGDRRFNVSQYQGVEFPRPTDAQVEALAGELQNFHHFLLSYEVDKQQASAPLQSEARDHLISLSLTTAESTAQALKDGDMAFFLDQLPTTDSYKLNMLTLNRVDNYRHTLADIMQRTMQTTFGHCNVSRDELFVIFDYTVGGMNPSPTSFTKYLGHRQLEIKPVSIGQKTIRGVPVRWMKADLFPEMMKAYFPEIKLKVAA